MPASSQGGGLGYGVEQSVFVSKNTRAWCLFAYRCLAGAGPARNFHAALFVVVCCGGVGLTA
jgi:hypothetical protein